MYSIFIHLTFARFKNLFLKK